MRKALKSREGDLNTTKAACVQMDKEIGWVFAAVEPLRVDIGYRHRRGR